MTECQLCDGRGWVWDISITATPSGPVESQEKTDCERCFGSGEIDKEEDDGL